MPIDRRTLNPSTLSSPPGYSHVVQVSGGATVYIAGQVALDGSGNLVGAGDFEAQARQVFNNLAAALAEVGATPSDLVKIGIYVVEHDTEKLGVVRRVRDDVLRADPPPASTLLGVAALALPEYLIEADGIAVLG